MEALRRRRPARACDREDASKRHHAIAGGTWYAVARRGLHAFAWAEKTGWSEIVDEKTGDKLIGKGLVAATCGTPDGLVAVSNTGAMFRLEAGPKGMAWKQLAKSDAGRCTIRPAR